MMHAPHELHEYGGAGCRGKDKAANRTNESAIAVWRPYTAPDDPLLWSSRRRGGGSRQGVKGALQEPQRRVASQAASAHWSR